MLLLGYDGGVAWVVSLPPPQFLVDSYHLSPYVMSCWFIVICAHMAVERDFLFVVGVGTHCRPESLQWWLLSVLLIGPTLS